MSAQPFFSVLVPTFNMGHLIGEAIESILHQSIGDFEVIIADNASSDNTEAVAKEACDPRLRYFRHNSNLGMYGNLNFLVRSARGRYIKTFCADDVMGPRCLERLRDAIEVSSAPMAFVRHTPHRHEVSDASSAGGVPRQWKPADFLNFVNIADRAGTGLPNLCVRADLLRAMGFITEGAANDYSKDIFTMFRLMLNYTWVSIDEPHIWERPHAGQSRFSLNSINNVRELHDFVCLLRQTMPNASERQLNGFCAQFFKVHVRRSIKLLLRHGNIGYANVFIRELRARKMLMLCASAFSLKWLTP